MNRIKELRQKEKISLAKLSQTLKDGYSINASPQTLMRYEKEETQPKLDIFKALADYFKVDIAYLQGIQKYKNSDARQLEIANLENKLIDQNNDIDYGDFIKRLNEIGIDSEREILEETLDNIPKTFQISDNAFDDMPDRQKLKLTYALQEIILKLLTTPNALDLKGKDKEKYVENALDKLLIFISREL